MAAGINQLYYGIVEDRYDPLKLGRCKVRVAGLHTHDITMLPTKDLPWAIVIQPVQSGNDIAAPKEGTEVAVFFADYPDNQIPVVLGIVPTIPQQKAVWIDQLPGMPKVRDIIAPTGRQLPSSNEQNAKDTNEEIRIDNQPTNNDKALTQNTINVANDSKTSSTQLIQASEKLPTSTGTSPRAAMIDQQLGHANQNQTERLIVISTTVGSETAATSLNALALAQKGISIGTDILNGKLTLNDVVDDAVGSISKLIGGIGSQATDKLLSAVSDSKSGSMSKLMGGLSTITDVASNGLSFDTIEELIDGAGDIGSGLSDIAGSALSGVGSLLSGSGSFLSDVGSSILKKTSSIFENFDISSLNLGSLFNGLSFSGFSLDSINLEGLLSGVGTNISDLLSNGLSFDTISNALGKAWDGIGQLGNGIGSFITSGLGLGDATSSLLSAETFNKIGDSITTGVSNLVSNAVENSESLISNLGVPSAIAGPISGAIKELSANGVSMDSLGNVWNKLKGPGGKKISLGSGFDTSSFTDGIEKKIRDCLACGAKPIEFIDSICEPIEKYGPALQNLLDKLADKTGFVTGFDASAITASVVQFLKAVRNILENALNLIMSGANKFLEYIKKAINQVAGVIFDIFNLGAALISEILNMLPFTDILISVVQNFVNSFLPGGQSRTDIGMDPDAVRDVVESGNYNSNSFKDLGCRDTIKEDKQARSSQFANVGSGNTPPVNGKQGGPNFGGADAKPTDPQKQDSSQNPSLATRNILNLTLPEGGFYYSDRQKSLENLIKISEKLESLGIKTLEYKAAFLAICFGYNKFIPNIRDFDYPGEASLCTAFPKTFAKAQPSVKKSFLFCQSKRTKTAEEFYNFVYDSSTDGKDLGNIEIGDGYKYAPAGLIHIVGRNEYKHYNVNSVQDLINDFDLCIEVSAKKFLELTNNILGSGSINFIYQAYQRFWHKTASDVIKAYNHFYGSKTFESYGTTEKIAGTSINPTSYYGSAQEKQPDTGFQDPNGKYPYKREVEKSTVSPLAKGDWINTIVSLKESKRITNVPTANNGAKWDQPHSAYHAQYPYNRVKETESGHIEEWDDTPGYERIQWYHRSGTFTEIDHNGTNVNRIVGDHYQIIDRNGYISISGDANVTVTGNVNIYCQSNASIQVEGSAEINSGGSISLGAAKDINLNAGGNVNISSRKGINLTAKNDINQTSQLGAIFLTSNDIISAVAANAVYVTSENKQVFVKAKTNVGIQSESSDIDIKAYNNALLSAYGGNLDLYSGSVASLSATSSININAGLHLRQYAGANMTLKTYGFLRTQASAIDTTSLTWYHLSTNSDVSVDSIGAINMSTKGLFSLGSTGYFNINSGSSLTIGSKGSTDISGIENISIATSGTASFIASGTMGIQAGGVASLSAGGTLGLNGSMVGLNSGFKAPITGALPPLTVVTIPALPSGSAGKASLASDVPTGQKALVWGSIPPVQGAPVMPNLAKLPDELPGNTEPIIEDDETANSNDAKAIEKTELSNAGYKEPIKGPELTNLSSSDVDNAVPKINVQLANQTEYYPNTRLSQHIVLNDMFDGGMNKRHVLQDQVGLTKQQIVCNLAYLANNVLEKVGSLMPGGWDGYKKRWFINSGFRSTAQNKRSGGSTTSQHCKGMACDIQIRGGTKQQHFEVAQQILKVINQDQMILEYNLRNTNCWIHLSVDMNKKVQRNDILTWAKWAGYKKGLIMYA